MSIVKRYACENKHTWRVEYPLDPRNHQLDEEAKAHSFASMGHRCPKCGQIGPPSYKGRNEDVGWGERIPNPNDDYDD